MSHKLIFLLVIGVAGCGSAPKLYTGPDPCKMGKTALSERLGPELSSVAEAAPLGRPDMCALVYLRVAEESPEELPTDENIEISTDHLLAVATVSRAGGVDLQTLGRSAAAPGPVRISLKQKNLYGTALRELIVEERAPSTDHALGYRGLRLFDVTERAAREVLARRLLIKTPEGLTVVPLWGATNGPEGPRIVFDAAGTKEIFTYNKALKRYALDKGATAAANPKPTPPTPPDGPAEAAEGKTEQAPPAKAPPAKAAPAKGAPELDLDAL